MSSARTEGETGCDSKFSGRYRSRIGVAAVENLGSRRSQHRCRTVEACQRELLVAGRARSVAHAEQSPVVREILCESADLPSPIRAANTCIEIEQAIGAAVVERVGRVTLRTALKVEKATQKSIRIRTYRRVVLSLETPPPTGTR
jgi:hypothetical protein